MIGSFRPIPTGLTRTEIRLATAPLSIHECFDAGLSRRIESKLLRSPYMQSRPLNSPATFQAAQSGHAELFLKDNSRFMELVRSEEMNMSGTEFSFDALNELSEYATKLAKGKGETLVIV